MFWDGVHAVPVWSGFTLRCMHWFRLLIATYTLSCLVGHEGCAGNSTTLVTQKFMIPRNEGWSCWGQICRVNFDHIRRSFFVEFFC